MAEVTPSNNAQSTLNGGINNSVTTITLADSSSFADPAGGTKRVIVDSEIISYTGKSSNDLTGCTRGVEGTSAASHSSGATVTEVLTNQGAINLWGTSAFRADKNGTNQTISASTWTKLTFTNEVFDTNGDYDAANSKFLPTVAGKYALSLLVWWNSQGSNMDAAIYKNGAVEAQVTIQAVVDGTLCNIVTLLVDANGSTDYWEAYAHQINGSRAVSGDATKTIFMGHRVA